MNRTLRLSALALTTLAAGCATMDELTVTPEQQEALARTGQHSVSPSYRQAGVLVTPGRNIYMGQTQGWSGVGNPEGDIWLARTAHQYGGVLTGPAAIENASSRSHGELQSLSALYELGASILARGAVHAALYIDVQAVMTNLLMLDPRLVQPLPPDTVAYLDVPPPLFDLGKTDLRRNDRVAIDRLGAQLITAPAHGVIVLAGYTDITGEAETNRKIAIGRASVVRDALRQAGVSDRAMVVFSKPQCCYTAPNDNTTNRQLNRRTEIEIGGPFVSSDFSTEGMVNAIARVMRTVEGDADRVIRVSVSAPDPITAERLQKAGMEILTLPEIGFAHVSAGYLGLSESPNLIYEVLKKGATVDAEGASQ